MIRSVASVSRSMSAHRNAAASDRRNPASETTETIAIVFVGFFAVALQVEMAADDRNGFAGQTAGLLDRLGLRRLPGEALHRGFDDRRGARVGLAGEPVARGERRDDAACSDSAGKTG